MFARLIANWVYGGFLAGLLLLLLTPVLVHSWPVSLVTTFLCLPVYMVHQYEEHDNDRFRLFVNQKIGKRRVGLSPLAVFVINVPGVWGVIGISLALAATVSAGFGLVAVYLVLLNGTIHLVQAVISRGYNPGLGTTNRLILSTRRIRYRRHSADWRRDFLDAHDRRGSSYCHSRRNCRPHNARTTRALTYPQLLADDFVSANRHQGAQVAKLGLGVLIAAGNSDIDHGFLHFFRFSFALLSNSLRLA